MNKSKIMVTLAAAAIVATLGVGSTLAYFTDNAKSDNQITMGKVDISLAEPLFGRDTDNTYKMGQVHPGQKIDKDPTVTVAADSLESYIRVKIDVTGLDKILIKNESVDYTPALIDTFLANGKTMSENGWFYTDGYYYYNKSVAPGGQVEVFDQFRIPEKWGNEIADKTFHINVTAEAIQAADFTPRTDGSGNITGWYYSDNTPVVPEAYVTK